MPRISVVIPVGPEPHHEQYLEECLASLRTQTKQPDEILLVDDKHFDPRALDTYRVSQGRDGVYRIDSGPFRGCDIWHSPWYLGVAHAFNFGVALAENECVFLLGADDRLFPECLEMCELIYEQNGQKSGYYYVGVEYSDGRLQSLPCSAAMVTKSLWKETRGFPTEVASGASDAAFISMLLGAKQEHLLVPVIPDKPLYWYRSHEQSDTAQRGPWQGVILATRDLVTERFKAQFEVPA